MSCECKCTSTKTNKIHYCVPGGDYLAVTKQGPMSEMDRRILHCKIRKESNKLTEEFVSLHIDVQTYLMEIDYKVPQLLTCIMDVKHVKQLSKESPLVELKTATSVSGVFLELISKNLISFLQFTVVKRIIEKFCLASQCLQKQLQQYERNFSEYILRRVCDSNIYNEKGRFEAFTTSDSKARSDHSVFPLTTEEWKKLTSHGIFELKCGRFQYAFEEKGKAMIYIYILCSARNS